MPIEISYVSAFLIGLLGGVHCVGMCGGIVTALSLGLTPAQTGGTRARLYHLLAYNAGRIASYTAAGALLGGVGWAASNWSGLHQLQQTLQLVAGLFMVALGLYLAGWWQGIARIERVGASLWKRLEPFGRRLFPIRSARQALALGVVWGWLPCGLVYSVLVWSISTASPVRGAGLMLSFGLGTLPNLLLMGVAAAGIAARVKSPLTRQLAGLLIILFGLYETWLWFTR